MPKRKSEQKSRSLTKKILLLLFKGFLIAVGIFLILYIFGSKLLSSYFYNSGFIYNAEQPYIDNLKSYVNENHISTEDEDVLASWALQNNVSRLTISRDRKLLFDSAYPDSILNDDTEIIALYYNWQNFHTVTFSDGDAEVYVYAEFETKYYILFYALSALISVLIWMTIFVLGVNRMVRRIITLKNSVLQIEHGDLAHPVINSQASDSLFPALPPGSDELDDLTRGLNHMRQSLAEKIENEHRTKEAQDALLLGMSHDLRTPLTGLVTYLEIAQKKPVSEECLHFIQKAKKKTDDIRRLSDQLFDHFLIHSGSRMVLEDPDSAEFALGDYISELCMLLDTDGFHVSSDDLFSEPAQVRICSDYMGRIIHNLHSNIGKFADANFPVVLETNFTNMPGSDMPLQASAEKSIPRLLTLSVTNHILKPAIAVESTGIGVKNIETMMEQMGGTCTVYSSPDIYSITIGFPIC